jgi:hypothetical protein
VITQTKVEDVSKSDPSTGGISFLGALALLFIGLKLGGVISWSWWWVTAPLWGPIVLVLAIMIAVGFVAGICFAAMYICELLKRQIKQ